MRFLLLALLVLAACAPDPEPTPAPEPVPSPVAPDDSVVGIVAASSQLTTVARALESSGLAETLRDPDAAYTLFAPSDAAFAALPEAEREALLSDPDRLAAVLRAHVLPNRMLSPDVIDGLAIEALAGNELALSTDGTAVRITDGAGTTATVTSADLDTSNGVVHVIDAVLSP